METLNLAETVQMLAAREAIRDLLMRYARAIDRVDRGLLEQIYWPEATDNHGSFAGSAAGFIDWVIPLLGTMEQTSHMLGNILIQLDGNNARTEAYFEAYHRIPRADAAPYDVVIGGRYVDWVQCRDGEWRIRDRTVIYDWVREYPDSADWAQPVLGLGFKANRGPGDASYRLLAPAGGA